MKIFVAILLVLAVSYAAQLKASAPREEPKNGAIDFLKGFFEGLGVKEDIEKLMKCMKDVEKVLEKIKEALQHLRHININDLKKGLSLLFAAVKEFLQMLVPCAEGSSIIHKLINAITNVNIMKIVLHIITHPVQFVHDVESTIVCFAKGDLFCAGKGIGDLLRIIFLTREQKMQDIDLHAAKQT